MLERSLLLVALTYFAGIPNFTSAATTKPNIILIYADDLGYGNIGCNGTIRGFKARRQ